MSPSPVSTSRCKAPVASPDEEGPVRTASPEIDVRRLIPPGANAVTIGHEGQRYTLRLTRTNKLILTK